MNNRIIALLAAGLLTAAALIGTGAGQVQDNEGNSLVFIGGAARSTSTGWVLINDANHSTLNATSVSCDSVSGQLTIMLPWTAAQVISAYVDTDETLSRLDIVSGVSAGLDRYIVRFSKAGAAVNCNSATLQGSSSNIWFGGIMVPAT